MWLNCCLLASVEGSELNAYFNVIPVTGECQEQNMSVNILLWGHGLTFLWCPLLLLWTLMHHMKAHNCKFPYNDCSTFARHRCQSKYFWNTEAAVGYWFSVIYRNKHLNQSITESDFVSLLGVPDLDWKEIVEKVKQDTFFPVQRTRNERAGRQ